MMPYTCRAIHRPETQRYTDCTVMSAQSFQKGYEFNHVIMLRAYVKSKNIIPVHYLIVAFTARVLSRFLIRSPMKVYVPSLPRAWLFVNHVLRNPCRATYTLQSRAGARSASLIIIARVKLVWRFELTAHIKQT